MALVQPPIDTTNFALVLLPLTPTLNVAPTPSLGGWTNGQFQFKVADRVHELSIIISNDFKLDEIGLKTKLNKCALFFRQLMGLT